MDKLNIAELLKDCPSGMELDCLLWDNVTFERVADDGIWIKRTDSKNIEHSLYVYNDGSFPIHNLGSLRTKCVIFPKGKTTWEGFQRPFKDGDIVCNIENVIIIYKKVNTKGYCGSFASLGRNNTFIPHYLAYLEDNCRFATEEEKQKLFDAIKTNGYKWNTETKTLEELIKPKFKIGDEIVKRNSINNSWIVSSVSSEYYGLKLPNGYSIGLLSISEQDSYELITKKFDITTLKPFDKVLVRDSFSEPWNINYFSYIDSARMFKTIMGTYLHCVPWEGNEYLLGSFEDCKDYYKIWKEL